MRDDRSGLRWSRTDRSRRDPVKSHGIHYTPPDLAAYLAKQIMSYIRPDTSWSILDPACGDGTLLAAIAEAAGGERIGRLTLAGLDLNQEALEQAGHRLSAFQGVTVELIPSRAGRAVYS
jgi:ubiquinone/menaquinone biosynthesis C-methylase UbiE